MSHHIPFDIQSEIMKKLPVKSLLQLRCVSKQWKSFIDSPKFINNYHINHTNTHHHLYVSYTLDTVRKYTSIVDNNTFPQQKFPLTTPESLSLLRHRFMLGSVDGLLCFYGFYGDVSSNTKMAVIWNPTLRKSVGIVVIPKEGYKHTIVGFGVCRDTSDPKLVKINVDKIIWVVEVFTLSTRVWRIVYTGAPFKSCDLSKSHVYVDGVIYFCAYDLFGGFRIISFDLKSEKFGEVCLPESLVDAPELDLNKVNESLVLLEYDDDDRKGDMKVCGVWSRKDGANNQFTKIYNIKVEGKWSWTWVLGFRNNGEVVMELDADNSKNSRIAVYEPLSGNINGVEINGELHTFNAQSFIETLLLLDESHSIIH